jgi:hypothetical protein
MDRGRRSAVALVVVGVVAGTAAILTMQAFREPLRDWLVENPSQTAARATLLIAAAGALLVIPLLAFAAYAWRLAARDAARARGLKIISSISVIFAILLAAILWRLSVVLTR